MEKLSKKYLQECFIIDELGRIIIDDNKILFDINAAAGQFLLEVKNYIDFACRGGQDIICPHANGQGCTDVSCRWPNPSCPNQCVNKGC